MQGLSRRVDPSSKFKTGVRPRQVPRRAGRRSACRRVSYLGTERRLERVGDCDTRSLSEKSDVVSEMRPQHAAFGSRVRSMLTWYLSSGSLTYHISRKNSRRACTHHLIGTVRNVVLDHDVKPWQPDYIISQQILF